MKPAFLWQGNLRGWLPSGTHFHIPCFLSHIFQHTREGAVVCKGDAPGDLSHRTGQEEVRCCGRAGACTVPQSLSPLLLPYALGESAQWIKVPITRGSTSSLLYPTNAQDVVVCGRECPLFSDQDASAHFPTSTDPAPPSRFIILPPQVTHKLLSPRPLSPLSYLDPCVLCRKILPTLPKKYACRLHSKLGHTHKTQPQEGVRHH